MYCSVGARPHGFFFAICTCFCSCSISQPRRPPRHNVDCRRPCLSLAALQTWRAALSVRHHTMPTVSEQPPGCLRPRVLLVSCSACLSDTAHRLNLKRSRLSYFSDCRSHDQLIDIAHLPATIHREKQRCYSATVRLMPMYSIVRYGQEQATPQLRPFELSPGKKVHQPIEYRQRHPM